MKELAMPTNDDHFWEGFHERSPEQQVDAMARARELLGEGRGPGSRLESRLHEAAAKLGVRWKAERVAGDEGLCWYAVVETQRGTVRWPVELSPRTLPEGCPDADEAIDGMWERAFRELGLLP